MCAKHWRLLGSGSSEWWSGWSLNPTWNLFCILAFLQSQHWPCVLDRCSKLPLSLLVLAVCNWRRSSQPYPAPTLLLLFSYSEIVWPPDLKTNEVQLPWEGSRPQSPPAEHIFRSLISKDPTQILFTIPTITYSAFNHSLTLLPASFSTGCHPESRTVLHGLATGYVMSWSMFLSKDDWSSMIWLNSISYLDLIPATNFYSMAKNSILWLNSILLHPMVPRVRLYTTKLDPILAPPSLIVHWHRQTQSTTWAVQILHKETIVSSCRDTLLSLDFKALTISVVVQPMLLFLQTVLMMRLG
jgi:hypothetical protein